MFGKSLVDGGTITLTSSSGVSRSSTGLTQVMIIVKIRCNGHLNMNMSHVISTSRSQDTHPSSLIRLIIYNGGCNEPYSFVPNWRLVDVLWFSISSAINHFHQGTAMTIVRWAASLPQWYRGDLKTNVAGPDSLSTLWSVSRCSNDDHKMGYFHDAVQKIWSHAGQVALSKLTRWKDVQHKSGLERENKTHKCN